jgi:phytoene synthase
MADRKRRDPALVDDLRWCEALTLRHSKSFHFAFHNLPREKAEGVWAVYAFCRLFDDAVDAPSEPEDFDLLCMQWIRFASGETPDTHMWRALRHGFERFGLERAPFDDLLAGLDGDRTFHQPENEEELFTYCHRVAGTVGLMLLPILSSDPAAREALRPTAVRLGDAMQLTNILRDIGEDLALGRIYLPLDRMRETGVTPEILAAGKPTDAFRTLWESLATTAESWYAEFHHTVHAYDADSRRSLRIASNAYREILHEVRRHGYDCLTKRNSVPAWKKAVLSVRAWFA